MSTRRLGSPSRLRQLGQKSNITVVGRIKPEFFDLVEAEYAKAVPIHAPDEVGTRWLLAHEELHQDRFNGVGYHRGKDLGKLSNLELHELANQQAEAGRKK